MTKKFYTLEELYNILIALEDKTEHKTIENGTFKLFIDDYNILNTKLNTIINKLAVIERTLGILSDDAPKLTDKKGD